jgi:hypothetical protein
MSAPMGDVSAHLHFRSESELAPGFSEAQAWAPVSTDTHRRRHSRWIAVMALPASVKAGRKGRPPDPGLPRMRLS